MSIEAELIANLKGQLESSRRNGEVLVREKNALQKTIGELLKQHEDDIRQITDLLLENMELKQKLGIS